jgi:very-short-patch-repair endonuclease
MSAKLKYARYLRRNLSEAEKRLWYLLRGRRLKDFKFKKQQVIAPYIVDFICIKEKLIIEVDGGQHAQTAFYDRQRTRFLEQKGFKVIRFWNNEVLGEAEALLNEILEQLKAKNP